MTFAALALLNAMTLLFVLLLEETLPREGRVQQSTLHSLLGLVKVVKNPVFTNLLLVGGFLTAPFMAYIAVASYVYVNEFHTSETVFSIYFAVTAAMTVAGPLLYGRLGPKPLNNVLWAAYGVAAIAGVLLLTVGKINPVLFMLSFIPFAIMCTYVRPFTAEKLLNAQKENIGAAAAVMNFGFTILGSLGMLVGSLRWPGYVTGIAVTILIFAAISAVIFAATGRLEKFSAAHH